ncbi:unnamed protein product [Danaus chrysippus]|uniref:(African queen) hypothetical protein n=1 Tax=Danaus chrysippus TaxID=151541 RepID=A0A8J2QP25_9NEOP|nr:unnamed protein product [Danaus chrysippus]
MEVGKVGRDVRIMVHPDKQNKFEKYMANLGLKPFLFIDDVQSLIDDQLKKPSRASRRSAKYDWTYYQNFEEIYDWMNETAAEYPDIVSLVDIGRSVENRPIIGMKIDYKKKENPIIGVFEGTLHAREWITPVTLTWIVKEFLTSRDEKIRFLAENIVWHVFPIVNPDGFIYTFNGNRMWRKNRSRANFTSCGVNTDDDMSNGVDLNRNFGYLWMEIGASQNPCSNTFAGPRAFSEPESSALANHVLRLKEEGNVMYYFGMHSYSQLILVPYSHVGGADVLEVSNYGDLVDPASGTGFDWAKGGAGIPLVFLYELRDEGQYGFLLPPEQIIPNSEEVLDSLIEIDRVARQIGYYSNVERYQLDFLQNLEKQQYLNVIFWTRPFRMFKDIQILVPREHLNVFKERLLHFHLNATITTNNIEKLFQQQKFKSYTRMKFESFSWNSFYDLESVYQWMTDIATKNSDRVKLKAIGKSAEGREILTLEIVTENPKGKVIVEGAIHGNEWLTTQFVTYLAFFLIYPDKSSNWRLRQVAKKYTWFLIPVVNPDGYDYSMKVIYKMELIYIVCLVSLYINPCTSKSYKNYTLFRGVPVTDQHLEFFKNLSEVYKATFWRSPGLVHRPVEFIIGPDKKKKFLRDAILNGIYYTTVIEDVQRAFDSQTVKTYVRRNMESFDWTSYFRLDDIYDWLHDLSVMYPKVMHLQNLGKSVEKRDILMAKISIPVRKKSSRPKIIVEGGIHSREWVSIAFVTYLLHQVLTTVDKKESKLKSIAEEYEWYFVPVLNPDGYEYSHTKQEKGLKAAKRIAKKYGTQYTVGTAYDTVMNPQDNDQLEFLKQLQNSEGLDFWSQPTRVGDHINVIAAPQRKDEFEHSLKKRNIYHDVLLNNLQEVIDSQVFSRKKRSTRDLTWTNYQNIDDIYDWFEELANNYSFVSLIHAGQSYEGRNITGVRINRGSRRAIFVEGGQIGADWLSPVVITYLVNQLVRGVDSEARDASSDFDWHIFPILNPDGHIYTQERDRFWIKNRRINRNGTIGVDLSRNWNSHWGVSGGSFNASQSTYVGLGPFSEKESRAISYYIDSIAPRLEFVLSMRSFGQRLLLPFAHSTEPMFNYNETIIVGRRAMGSMAVKYNTQYIVGTSKEVHDGSTGSLTDWVKHRYSVPFAATYLLRDNGTFGYALPVSQVLPSCEETYDSIMAILREAKFIRLI